ncbi:YciI family protein [Ideonella sp.]|uniref:YciI family protein n=1 Tax=Ideonella sp. TaxID=1929293 RepID=UPI002B46252B|nr:YciI family protein [Ideonella sp.]HJV70827.1 YciI family protein [Ideonella sp.]HSN33352.1 YciI family protein [Ideonella sp.]
MLRHLLLATGLAPLLLLGTAGAEPVAESAKPAFDAELATSVGADEHGMRNYVLVVLKTGPNRMPAGPERDAMFKGHFANINRLAAERKLALAGPFDGVDGWRGMFVFAVKDIEEAKALVATDPVIINGEMVAEYHKYYGSAALMLVNEAHQRVTKTAF